MCEADIGPDTLARKGCQDIRMHMFIMHYQSGLFSFFEQEQGNHG